MKTKSCATCNSLFNLLFRIRTNKNGLWFFVCEECCVAVKNKPEYQYGGTWNGKRH
ncbi:MAG: hypothetical protein H7221_00365 [Flavobacterium sp.]|nr:hypothetical protein [Flavobacterium sp.]